MSESQREPPILIFLDGARYYNAPDGEKPIEKIVATVKKGIVGALALGINDICWFTSPKNVFETINCMAFWMVPIVGMSASFASVTFMSTKIRGKDDKWNYAIGATSCAPILHAWRKSTLYTLWGTAALIGIAIVAKHKDQHKWELAPIPKHRYGNYELSMSLLKPEDKSFRSPYVTKW